MDYAKRDESFCFLRDQSAQQQEAEELHAYLSIPYILNNYWPLKHSVVRTEMTHCSCRGPVSYQEPPCWICIVLFRQICYALKQKALVAYPNQTVLLKISLCWHSSLVSNWHILVWLIMVHNVKSREQFVGDDAIPIHWFISGSNVGVEFLDSLTSNVSGMFRTLEMLHKVQKMLPEPLNCYTVAFLLRRKMAWQGEGLSSPLLYNMDVTYRRPKTCPAPVVVLGSRDLV